MDIMGRYFRPEFLARLTEIVPFSPITEQIVVSIFNIQLNGLLKILEKQGIESVETDLGEYIVQLRNEAPYHIVTPAMHLSKEDVAKTFNEKFSLPVEMNFFRCHGLRLDH